MSGNYAVCLSLPVGFMHQSQFVRGCENWLTDLLLNRRFAEALMDRALEIKIEKFARILRAAANEIDMVMVGDDIAFQDGPKVSPRLYSQVIAPRQRRLFDALHGNTSAAVLYHACGAIAPLIPTLIDMGVGAIHPIQVSTTGMNTRHLKREFGRDLSF